MHRLFAACAVLLTTMNASAAPPKPDPAKFGWFTNYTTAKAEAKRTGKPIFLVFRCEP